MDSMLLLIYGIAASGSIGLLILLFISRDKKYRHKNWAWIINDCTLIAAGSEIRTLLSRSRSHLVLNKKTWINGLYWNLFVLSYVILLLRNSTAIRKQLLLNTNIYGFQTVLNQIMVLCDSFRRDFSVFLSPVMLRIGNS